MVGRGRRKRLDPSLADTGDAHRRIAPALGWSSTVPEELLPGDSHVLDDLV